MSKWEARINKILKDERQKHVSVYKLNDRLKELIHGFSPVDKDLLHQEIQKVCDSVVLTDSTVTSITFEPRFKKSENKVSDQIITINITGDFTGYIIFETGSGYRNTDDGRVDIFYVWSSDNKVVSIKEEQCRDMYKKYKHFTVEKLIDVAMENKYYLAYDDYFKNYEIWDKQPSEYSDSLKGELKIFNENEGYKYHKRKNENLNKINKYNSIKEFAEDILDGHTESVTYEWYEYQL